MAQICVPKIIGEDCEIGFVEVDWAVQDLKDEQLCVPYIDYVNELEAYDNKYDDLENANWDLHHDLRHTEKQIVKLEGDIYQFENEIVLLKEELQSKKDEISDLENKIEGYEQREYENQGV